MPTERRLLVALAVCAAALSLSSCGGDRSAVRIGLITDCEGGLSFLYQLNLSGAELPLLERGAKLLGDQPSDGVSEIEVGGRRVRVVMGCAASSATSGLAEARRLVEREHVDVVVGPQFSEAYAVKRYAATRRDVTFVIACCAPQSTMLHDPLPNVFSFAIDLAQAGAGLGTHGFRLGWRRAVLIGQDEALHWSYAAGVVAEFCALGGEMVKRIWVSPLADPADVLAAVPKTGVDGIFYLSSAGPPLLALLNGLPLLRDGLAGKVLGQATAFVDASQSLGKRLDGVIYSSGGMNGTPGTPGAAYIDRLADKFPKLFRLSGLLAPAAGFGLAYRNGMEAVLQALEQVDGDLSGGQRGFMAALAKVELDAPNGHVRLDRNRQAIAPNYLNRLNRNAKGELEVHTFLTIPDVDQSFGGLFDASSPPPGRTTPACKRDRPPPWAADLAAG